MLRLFSSSSSLLSTSSLLLHHHHKNRSNIINVRFISDFLNRIALNDRVNSIAATFPNSSNNNSITYGELNILTSQISHYIKSKHKDVNIIGSYHQGESGYLLSMIAAWKTNLTFVPLSTSHPEQELKYFVEDSSMGILLHSLGYLFKLSIVELIDSDDIKNPEEYAMLQRLGVELVHIPTLVASLKPSTTTTTIARSDAHGQDGALVLYTSGTTGRPKGVLHTRAGLQSAIQALVQSWEYSDKDRILHFLPLHHLHGVLNKLLCIMWAGGTIEFAKSANTVQIWKRLAKESIGNDLLTVFMAVPTVYARMLEDVRKMKTSNQINEPTSALTPSDIEKAVVAMKKMRLMACGSAALPDPIMDQWLALSGHVLLERYGMTEIGMALSNPYKGIRRKGFVGTPLPLVECRIVGDDEKEIISPEQPGELRVKGPNVFNRYLNKQDATRESFDKEGWFKTGDTAVFIEDCTTNDKKEKIYKLLGRSSTDIIKSGGYKLSALEIERELLAHPQIAEAAVIGKKDDVYGEVVVAFISLRSSIDNNITFEKKLLIDTATLDSKHTLEKMREFLNSRLASYKQPRIYHIVPSIPRNHLGKVNKKSLSKDLGFE